MIDDNFKEVILRIQVLLAIALGIIAAMTAYLFADEVLAFNKYIWFIVFAEITMACMVFVIYWKQKKKASYGADAYKLDFFGKAEKENEGPLDKLSLLGGLSGVIIALFIVEAWADMPPEYALPANEFWLPLKLASSLFLLGMIFSSGYAGRVGVVIGRLLALSALLAPLYLLITGPRPPMQ